MNDIITNKTNEVNETNELMLVKNIIPALISFNDEELKRRLKIKLENYQNLIVTADTLKGAKNDKKELAGLRLDLDAFRKAVKKEAEKPIKEFEAKIKNLIALVEEVEKPLDESISYYDDKVRGEKRAFAEELIKEAIASYELRPEYATKMILKDEYMNLSGTKKAVKEGISKQAELLKQEQDNYDANVNFIKTTVEEENKRIKIKLKNEKFIALLDSVDITGIISQIKEEAFDIYLQENPKTDVAVDVTSLFMPDNTVTVNDNSDNSNVATESKNDNVVISTDLSQPSNDEGIPTIPDCFIAPTGLNVNDNFIPAVGIIPTPDTPKDVTTTDTPFVTTNDWKCVFEVTGDFDTLRGLNTYMKEHGIGFRVISQEKINNIN